ncbi:MAG: HAMP domain-containing protein [Verrucomicrobiales bacterium]|nr:HAMP domain-containing protein [Verrucomicrobiales bacterium]
MKIRTHTLLLITPIFLLLGVAISIMVYMTERRELLWGLQEESKALAISIAEFLDGDQLDSELQAGVEALTQFERVEAVLQHGQLKYARLLISDDSEVGIRLVRESGDEQFDPAGIPKRADLDLARWGGFAVSPVQEQTEDMSLIKALTPIHAKSGKTVAFLEVVTDATDLKTHSQTTQIRCLKLTGGLVLAGIVISISLSGFLVARLRELGDAARVVASGDYDHEIESHSIREINDLGSTFNTMRSILKDVLTKAKKELVEVEEFRRPEDLAVVCRNLTQQRQQLELGPECEILLGVTGKVPTGNFAGFIRTEEKGHRFFLGKIRESDSLEATVRASAAAFLLKKLLAVDTVPEALRKAGHLFRFEVCLVMESNQNENSILRCHQVPGEVPDDGNEIPFGPQDPVVVTTAGMKITGRLARFMDSVGRVEEAELDFLLDELPATAYLIVQEKGADS